MINYTRLKNSTVYLWLIKTLLARKIQFKEKNSNWMLNDSFRIFQGLFEFNECLIARKLIFKVNLGFNWKKLKYEDRIAFL